MKGLKLICSFWVAVGFVLFFLDSFPGVSTHVMYSNLPNEASYEVVDVDTGGTVTVEYTVDGDIHEHQVVSPYGSYAVGDTGVLRYERVDVPVLDTEVSDNVRYSKTIMLILIFCLAVLIVYRARGIV